MSAVIQRNSTAVRSREIRGNTIAAAYNESGERYIAYADGDPKQLFSFDGQFGYGDRRIWETLFEKLCTLRASGRRSVRILDLGCGPGTWLRRIVARARAVGFDKIMARGFDIAGDQVRLARQLSADLAALPGVDLVFEVDNISEPFVEADATVDFCLCLSSVINHLPAAGLPAVLKEIARVTKGEFIATIRTSGSTPSVYVDAIEHACRFQQDNRADRLDVEFDNGRRISLPSHLYSATELHSLVSPLLGVRDICGLDLFHSRFAGDARWNPDVGMNRDFAKLLEQLEMTYCRDAAFIDHSTHLLLVGGPRDSSVCTATIGKPEDSVCVTPPSIGTGEG